MEILLIAGGFCFKILKQSGHEQTLACKNSYSKKEHGQWHKFGFLTETV